MSTAKNKLDTGLIRELAAILREADLGELEVEHEGLRVRVSKPLAPTVVRRSRAPAGCRCPGRPACACRTSRPGGGSSV